MKASPYSFASIHTLIVLCSRPVVLAPALFVCNYKVFFSGGEASEGWEGLSVQRHPESVNVYSQLS